MGVYARWNEDLSELGRKGFSVEIIAEALKAPDKLVQEWFNSNTCRLEWPEQGSGERMQHILKEYYLWWGAASAEYEAHLQAPEQNPDPEVPLYITAIRLEIDEEACTAHFQRMLDRSYKTLTMLRESPAICKLTSFQKKEVQNTAPPDLKRAALEVWYSILRKASENEPMSLADLLEWGRLWILHKLEFE